MILPRSGVRRVADGLKIRLTLDERDLLSTLPAQLRDAFTGEAGTDELQARLFPPAYDEADHEAVYHLLHGQELAARRSETLDRFLASFHKGGEARGNWTATLDWDEADAWLQVVNDTRLVLATVEGITDESDWDREPHSPQQLLLLWLGWFEEQLVAALMSTLD